MGNFIYIDIPLPTALHSVNIDVTLSSLPIEHNVWKTSMYRFMTVPHSFYSTWNDVPLRVQNVASDEKIILLLSSGSLLNIEY